MTFMFLDPEAPARIAGSLHPCEPLETQKLSTLIQPLARKLRKLSIPRANWICACWEQIYQGTHMKVHSSIFLGIF